MYQLKCYKKLLSLFVLVILTFTLSSCFYQSVERLPLSSDQSQSSDSMPPPRQLKDPDLNLFEVTLGIYIGGYNPDEKDKTFIHINFVSEGRIVEFTGQEKFICNDQVYPLQKRNNLHLVEGPTATLVGKMFICTYTAAKYSSTFTFTVPNAPVLLAPQEGATLKRTKDLRLSYQAQGDNVSIVARSPKGKAIAQMNTPSLGQAQLDASKLDIGDGTLYLRQDLNVSAKQSDQPFKGVSIMSNAISVTKVKWV